MTAITALTAQNTMGVNDIHYIPPTFVKKAIDACVEDVGVDVIKTGKSSYYFAECLEASSNMYFS
jgi:hydroxymethylpyrimidine/phosphomethylpyrimidine kinase